MENKENLAQRVKQSIVSVQDFPSQGIDFKDISPLFLNPSLYQEIVDFFVEKARGKVEMVCGIESRGYLFGIGIAQALGVPFVLIRKAGKLPPPVLGESYSLEYGQAKIEIKKNAIKENQRVLIHDDLLATGGTAAAACSLVEKLGGVVIQCSFLIELENLKGREKLKKNTGELVSLLKF